MRTFLLILFSFIFLGCAPKVIERSSLNASLDIRQTPSLAVYDTRSDRILFYTYTVSEGKLLESSWGKILPFRVEFMDMWVSGLGHDLRRLSNNHAETIHNALMYNAQKQGLISLHVSQNDYLLDTAFAHEMVDVITAYEERMKRYKNDRDLFIFPKI